MKKRAFTAIAALALFAAMAAFPADSDAQPGESSLSSFADISGLLDEASPGPFTASSGFVATRQDDWGWGDEEKSPVNPDEGESTQGPGEPEEPNKPAPAAESAGRGETEETGSRNWAKKTRIGIEFGGFLPMGAMEEPYSSGQFAGLFFGFGLPSSLGEYMPTVELRLVEGMTSSFDQDRGFDMSTTLLGLRLDFLFHLMPKSRSFNAFFFFGAGAMLELTSGKGFDSDTGDPISVSGTYPFFVVDAGIGAWLNLAGPLDVFLRIELDLIPASTNVSTFAVGELGLQVRL